MATKVYSGNTIVISMDNKQIGLLQDLTANEDYGLQPASGIGDPRVAEYVPGLYQISLTCSSMAIKRNQIQNMGDTLFSAGIFPNNLDEFLKRPAFTISIMDKNGGTIREYTGCVFASGSLSVRKHAVVGSNCSFFATDVVPGTADGF